MVTGLITQIDWTKLKWFSAHMNDRRSFLNRLTSLSLLSVGGAGAYGLLQTCAPTADVVGERTGTFSLNLYEPGRTYAFLLDERPISIRVLNEEDETILLSLPESTFSTSPILPSRFDPEQQVAANTVAATPDGLVQGQNLRVIILQLTCPIWGCIPSRDTGDFGDTGGFFCPCHGSHFDLLGRVHRGPSPANLTSIMMDFTSDATFQVPYGLPTFQARN